MARNDNSVNMKKTKDSYHHGDLRAALISEALKLLEKQDLEHLSLREVARNVGVSATAVYRHFPAKDDLLKALADHGLAMLGAQQKEAAAKARGRLAFAQTGRAYVRFALANPNLFRLIFAHMPARTKPGAMSPEGLPARLMQDFITMDVGPKASTEQVFLSALRAWSIVHGLSMLILDEQVDRKVAEGLIDRVIA
ncbi:MAG: TetR/AcrR family transcriptional regulator [Alphaproteobacteria bacterium]|nr:TetR/AcrR family transcriptional regulator [Alphaproteobacteria bacterium]